MFRHNEVIIVGTPHMHPGWIIFEDCNGNAIGIAQLGTIDEPPEGVFKVIMNPADIDRLQAFCDAPRH